MKKIIFFIIFLLLSCGLVHGAGGKNHGSEGQGTVSTGDQASGEASQSRSGR